MRMHASKNTAQQPAEERQQKKHESAVIGFVTYTKS